MSQYQSLYRRFRPQQFSEIKGQDHVVRALQNAVRNETVSHAYLFSGPRGTGKTSSARILAKALNCQNLTDSEPCGKCDSCIAVEQGTSLDVHELDAASNNGVDAMRDLVSRAALGTPGRWKVYIIDEVHMLSTAASNALLKTLEEPPAHVIFVLATTDPQKVLPTIRSRTQHLEFRLLPSDVLSDLLGNVRDQAHLDVADEAVEFAVRRGHGSARDALSLLDQVAASGSAHDSGALLDDIINGFIENDTARVLTAVAESIHAGSDARRLATDIIEHLRNAFLATMSKGLVPLPDDAIDHIAEQAHQLGTPRIVRIMETVGQALVDMRDTVDPRLTLEIALIKVTTTATETPVPPAEPKRETQKEPAPVAPSAPPTAELKKALGGYKANEKTAKRTVPTHPQRKSSPTKPTGNAVPLTREALVKVWADKILAELPQRARSRYRSGRFTSVEGNTIEFAVPNQIHRDRCNEIRSEVEQAINTEFQTRVTMEIVVDNEAPAVPTKPEPEGEETIDLSALTEVNDSASSIEDRLKELFPGAEEVS